MSDLGLQGAYAVQGMQGALRQRIMDQLAAEKQAQELAIQRQEMDLKQRQFAGQEQDRRAALLERTQAARDASAGKAAPGLMGQNIPMEQYQKGFEDTTSAGLFAPQISLPATQFGGGAPTPSGAPSGLMDGGDQGAPPPVAPPAAQTVTPALQRATGRMIGTGTAEQQKTAADDAQLASLAADPNTPPALKQFLRVRGALPKGENVPYQLITEPGGPPKPPGPIESTASGLARIDSNNVSTPILDKNGKPVQGYHPPVQGDNALVRVEHKDPATGKTVIEYLPKSDVRGKTFEAGAGSVVQNRLASAEAVSQVGNDIITAVSDPKVAATLGPALGRYNTLRDFIGNPPPEFAQLAGQIESYSLGNMGVHGMRSVQGADEIKKLLEGHHTPASLAAGVRGLNTFAQHYMENQGFVPKGGTTPPPTGNDVVPPPAAGVKRYNPATGKVE